MLDAHGGVDVPRRVAGISEAGGFGAFRSATGSPQLPDCLDTSSLWPDLPEKVGASRYGRGSADEGGVGGAIRAG